MMSNRELVFGLTSADLLAWIDVSADVLAQSADLLNSANVFPVPDGDTGTNLLLTVRGAQDRAHKTASAAHSPSEVLTAAALGALTNARGNSGIILAEYLRGFAHAVSYVDSAIPQEQLVFALERASQRAYSAVSNPVEGTILTAARAAASSAREALGSGQVPSVLGVLEQSIDGATKALDRSHLELNILGSAGVLDSGAYGLVLFLSALHAVVSNVPVTQRSGLGSGSLQGTLPLDGVPESDGEFEVMCLVAPVKGSKITDDVAGACTLAFRAALSEIGQSVVVIGGAHGDGDALWSVHVHTDQPDSVMSAVEQSALVPVELSQVVLRNLSHQISARSNAEGTIKLVACTSSPLLATDLSRAGAIVCVERNVPLSVTDIERALTEVHATEDGHQTAVIVANSEKLSSALRATIHAAGVVLATDDAQVVAATSAIVMSWESQSNGTSRELGEVGRLCVQGLITERFKETDRQSLAPLINEVALMDEAVVVTLLTDVDCPHSAIADLIDGLERAHTGVEVIALASGKLGNGLTVSIEQLNEPEW